MKQFTFAKETTPKRIIKANQSIMPHGGRGLSVAAIRQARSKCTPSNKGTENAKAIVSKIRAMGYEDVFMRCVEKYFELSEAPGENTDLLYEKMGRTNR